MSFSLRPGAFRRYVCAAGLVVFFIAPGALLAVLQAMQAQPGPPGPPPVPPFATASSDVEVPQDEVRLALERLSLAAVFGTALALRPRRRTQGARKVVVIQTQIMRPWSAP